MKNKRLLKKCHIPEWAILITFCFIPSVFAQSPNDVIVNEYNDDGGDCGSPEWVELLVVSGPVTMRNRVLTDNEDENYDSGGGEGNITFADDSVFDNIPMRTYIVVYVGDGTDDTDFSDGTMALYTGNLLLTMTRSFSLNASGDNIGLYTSLGGVAIDYIAYGNENAPPPANLTWTTNISGTEDEDAYFSDGINFNNDDASKWVTDADGSGCGDRTIGVANPGQDDSSLPIELSLFTATITKNGVKIHWKTESETNNLGFWLYRSEQPKGKYVKINPVLIRGAGTSGLPHEYTFKDVDVEKGIVYYYFIEDVAFDGATSRTPIIRTRHQTGKQHLTWGQLKRK